ncbi:MAG: C39 family peptidase [Bacteroidota bacterium]
MNTKIVTIFLLIIVPFTVFSQSYPDQQIILKNGSELLSNIEESKNIIQNSNNSLELASDALDGYFILKPQNSDDYFNRGLPSWNGFAPENENSSFKVMMRFKVYNQWQRWVTVGYWDKEIWSSYGYTSFTGGNIAIDYVKLNEYISEFQFKVVFKRNSTNYAPPSIEQLSFFVSDSKTTDNLSLTDIYNDNPDEIFIPTDHIYQYDVDDEIGADICSPSTTSMILKSYDINVDPYEFALRTKDKYWDLFGVWPRVVQHAHEYGLEGTVNRYRTWSEAYEALKSGKRIAMSIGQPLYSGHLVMLAGFDKNGNPIVHDPAKSDGYSKVYSKYDISKAWFNKGGIAYTFYFNENTTAIEDIENLNKSVKISPNPVTGKFTISVNIEKTTKLSISIADIKGVLIGKILEKEKVLDGKYILPVNEDLTPGIYFIKLKTNETTVVKRLIKR